MSTSPKIKSLLRNPLAILAFVVAAISLAFIFAYQSERSAFKEVQGEVERIEKVVEGDFGGVKQPLDGQRIGILSTLNECWSNKCPFFARSWKLNLEKSSEVEVMKKIMLDTGYTVTHEYPCSLSESTRCGILAHNERFQVGVDLTPYQGANNESGAKMEVDLRVLVTLK